MDLCGHWIDGDRFQRVWGVARLGGPAWLVVFSSLALSLLSVYSVDVAESVQPHVLPELGHIALRQLIFVGAGYRYS